MGRTQWFLAMCIAIGVAMTEEKVSSMFGNILALEGLLAQDWLGMES